MKNNPKGRPQKPDLKIVPAGNKKATMTPLRTEPTEKSKPMVYKMPPQQQWFLKGKDKDCL
jgi:hypothetical protein